MLLVEQEQPIIKDGLVTVKVLKSVDNSEYKVGDRLLINKVFLTELKIDGDVKFNVYYVIEENVFAKL